MYVKHCFLVAIELYVSWAKSWRCWIISTMAWNILGGVRMLHVVVKINNIISIIITILIIL